VNPMADSTIDAIFMAQALKLARKALVLGEFPVGCVIADGKTVVAQGHRTGTATDVENEIDHAEINAIRSLCEKKPAADRKQLTLYCTMEPCMMCFSAIILSGIRRIVYAYEDVMGGGAGLDLSHLPPLYREAQLTVVSAVMRRESLSLFQQFFSDQKNGYWSDSMLSRYTLNQALEP